MSLTGRKGGAAAGEASRQARELAQGWGPKAIERLAVLAGLAGNEAAESLQTQMGALKELLDRAYGRPQPAVPADPETPLLTRIERIIVGTRKNSEA